MAKYEDAGIPGGVNLGGVDIGVLPSGADADQYLAYLYKHLINSGYLYPGSRIPEGSDAQMTLQEWQSLRPVLANKLKTSIDPQALGLSLYKEFQDDIDKANQANENRYGQIQNLFAKYLGQPEFLGFDDEGKPQYGETAAGGLDEKLKGLFDQGMGVIDQFGEGARGRIDQAFDQSLASSLQGLMNQGVAGTTIRANTRLGTESEKQRSLNDLEDQIAQLRLGTIGQLGSQSVLGSMPAMLAMLQFMGDRTDEGPDISSVLAMQQLLGQAGFSGEDLSKFFPGFEGEIPDFLRTGGGGGPPPAENPPWWEQANDDDNWFQDDQGRWHWRDPFGDEGGGGNPPPPPPPPPIDPNILKRKQKMVDSPKIDDPGDWRKRWNQGPAGTLPTPVDPRKPEIVDSPKIDDLGDWRKRWNQGPAPSPSPVGPEGKLWDPDTSQWVDPSYWGAGPEATGGLVPPPGGPLYSNQPYGSTGFSSDRNNAFLNWQSAFGQPEGTTGDDFLAWQSSPGWFPQLSGGGQAAPPLLGGGAPMGGVRQESRPNIHKTTFPRLGLS